MQIKFEPEAGLLIHFPPNELKFGLAVLKGIYQVVKADFIQNCINDLEEHLKPKALPMIGVVSAANKRLILNRCYLVALLNASLYICYLLQACC